MVWVQMSTEQNKLLGEAMDGHVVALQRLLLENYDRLAKFLAPRIPVKLRPVCDVEDILQVTFVQVYQDFASFRGQTEAEFYAWIQAIAEAKSIDAIRTATRQKRGGNFKRVEKGAADSLQSYLDLLDQLSGQQRSPSQSIAARDAIEAIQVAISALPNDQREAVTLRFVHGEPIEQVARDMEKSEDAVRGLLHRGKAALKLAMGNSSKWFSQNS